MKKSELEEKIKGISTHISENMLIETLYDLARKGKGKVTQESSHTNHNYKLECGNLKIILDDGGIMGQGDLEVFYDGKRVLSLDRHSDGKEYIPSVNHWGVLEYHKGDWEENLKEIKETLERPHSKAKKETYNEEHEVPKELLRELEKRYDLE
ncbi:MAG: hypothetical protein Q8Q04_02900 [archaeon]|nr:hypothetical protein [archaeon]